MTHRRTMCPGIFRGLTLDRIAALGLIVACCLL